MATVWVYQGLNMLSPSSWDGTVTEASDRKIRLTNYAGKSAIYTGWFTYNATDLIGGIVTDYEQYNNYRLDYQIFGISLEVEVLKYYTDREDIVGLYQYALKDNDRLNGSSFSDTLVGWNGNDYIWGGYGDDKLFGGNGNDSLNGEAGSDYLIGGEGIDIAIFNSSSGQYRFLFNADFNLGIEIRDTVSNRDGTDYLIEVERLQFSDINIALDLEGSAGQAYRIYEAVLGRAPDLKGLGYWIKDMDNGVSLTAIAQGFIASPEFKGKYGTNPSYETYISLLYNNILGRAPDTAGMNYWVSNMRNGTDSPAVVLASFSEGYENRANVASDIANGIYYTPWIT